MGLPTIELPKFKTELPSNGKQVEYWPMTIAQEKVLLIAKESDGDDDILKAVVDIVSACSSARAVWLPMCDINWLFLQIRKVSVSNVAKLSFAEDMGEGQEPKQHDFDVDLGAVTVDKTNVKPHTLKVNDQISIVMQYTPVNLYMAESYQKANAEERFDMVLKNSIVSVATEDEVHKIDDMGLEEVTEWAKSLPSSVYVQIEEFLGGMPSLFYEIKYTDTKGEEQRIVLSELTDFFPL